MAEKKSKVAVIREYFGKLPHQESKDFLTEMKNLSDKDKIELAQGAAREIGLRQEDVDFSLT